MAKNGHNNQGPSQRQLRVGEVIRRTLAGLLSRGDVHDPDLQRLMITVSEVRPTPDLRIATVFVLPLGGDNKAEAIEALKRNKHELRRAVGKVTKLKFTPDLRFLIDDSFDRMDETRRLFAQDDVQRDLQAPDAGEPDADEN